MPDYYSSQQLLQTLGIAESTIVELETNGLLRPTVKDGRCLFSARQARCFRVAVRWARKDKMDLQEAFACVEECWLARTTSPTSKKMQNRPLSHSRVVDDRRAARIVDMARNPSTCRLADRRVFSRWRTRISAARREYLAKWQVTPASQFEELPGYCLEVETVEVPEWLSWLESGGFIVRRTPEEGNGND